MKNIVITLLAISAFSFSATAQEKREMKPGHMPGMHKQHHGMMMAKELNFSEEQKAQVKLNREDFKNKMQELNKIESITVKEQRDRKAALLKEQKSKMDALLTPEQKTKMAQLKADRKIKGEEHFTKHLDKMKTTLGLTDKQIDQMKKQREAMQSRFKAIMENEALSREQRRDQFMALKAEGKEQHKKILTPDQIKKMEEMKKKHFEKTPSK
jgi:periplasmic protein CpxP/Spy